MFLAPRIKKPGEPVDVLSAGQDAVGVKNRDGVTVIPCNQCHDITFNPVFVELLGPDCGVKSVKEANVIKKWIHDQGQDKLDLFIVGEAPGYDETINHRPFIGKSGELLRQVLKGTDAFFAIGNSVLCRPTKPHPNNPNLLQNRTPTKTEYDLCSILIKHTVKYTNPRSILLLGRTPMEAFLGGAVDGMSLTKARQLKNNAPNFKWLGITTFVTWHPSYVLRKGGEGTPTYYEFIEDVARAIRGDT